MIEDCGMAILVLTLERMYRIWQKREFKAGDIILVWSGIYENQNVRHVLRATRNFSTVDAFAPMLDSILSLAESWRALEDPSIALYECLVPAFAEPIAKSIENIEFHDFERQDLLAYACPHRLPARAIDARDEKNGWIRCPDCLALYEPNDDAANLKLSLK